MKAIRFVYGLPRYVLSKALGTFYPSVFWSRLSCLEYREVPPPALIGEDWARVKVRLGGICGSDMGLIRLESSPSTSPFVSFPLTLGHENVGTIVELGSEVQGFALGERVVVEPILGCRVRGFSELCPACARGEHSLCQRFREGRLAPGFLTGFCRDTGGSWSPGFIAHSSQLFQVPAEVDDENAVIVEPFAVALHAVMGNWPEDGDVVLVMGAGAIGLLVVAALRALGSRARVLVLAKYPFQAEAARKLGADEAIRLGSGLSHYGKLAEALGASLHKPLMGKPMAVGGADLTYDCVGTSRSLDEALRFTRGGGRMVLVGAAATLKGVDPTPIWFKEVQVSGSWIYDTELYRGRQMRTFQVALELMAQGEVNLAPLVTHRFRLEEYRQALAAVAGRGRTGVIKAVFALE